MSRQEIMAQLMATIETALEDDTKSPEDLEALGRLLGGVVFMEIGIKKVEWHE